MRTTAADEERLIVNCIDVNVNGSLNIVCKVIPTDFILGIELVFIRSVGFIPNSERAFLP